MIDFSTMEYGVIKAGKGAFIIVKGTFYGPFNSKQLGVIVDKMKEDEKWLSGNV